MPESKVQQENTTIQEEKALHDMTPQELLQYAEKLKKDYEKLSSKHVKYGLVWEDYEEDVVKECQDKLPVLQEITERFVKGEAKKIETKSNAQLDVFGDTNEKVETVPTENINHILIEGDNYHALSVLNYTHKGKIDVIYIDPPYNTGNNDFIYNDRFVDKNDSYRHSKWISFMEKRLRLAKELLKETGVIFISIDDNEVANLRLLCDKVFGESNFIELFSWIKTSTPPNLATKSRKTAEYLICYEKNRSNLKYKGDLLLGGDAPLLNSGNTRKIIKFKKEVVLFKLDDGSYQKGIYDRVNLLNDIEIKNGKAKQDFEIEGEFKWTQDTLNSEIVKGTTFLIKSNKFSIRFQRIINDEYKAPINLIKENILSPLIDKKQNNVDTNEMGAKEIEDIFHNRRFDFPKPVSLIKYIINFLPIKNSTILDFFAGSGTTAHAVMQLNAEDGGNRQCILVTNNENNICEEVTYERCKRVIEGYTNLKGEQIAGLSGNNLRYFKTDYVDYTLNDDAMKFAITGKCTEMLCLRENVFDLYLEGKNYKIYQSSQKTVAIFYNLYSSELLQLRDVMNSIEGEKLLYYFSLDSDISSSEFRDWKNINIQPIPKKILDLYKQLFRKV